MRLHKIAALLACALASGCEHYWVASDELCRVAQLPRYEQRRAAVPAVRESDDRPVYLKARLLGLEPATQTLNGRELKRARAIPAIQPAGVIVLGIGLGLVAGGAVLTHQGVGQGNDPGLLGGGIAMIVGGSLHALIGGALTGFGFGVRPQEVGNDRRDLVYVDRPPGVDRSGPLPQPVPPVYAVPPPPPSAEEAPPQSPP